MYKSLIVGNGLKCFNCDSHDDKDCLDLNGNSTELELEVRKKIIKNRHPLLLKDDMCLGM